MLTTGKENISIRDLNRGPGDVKSYNHEKATIGKADWLKV
jgi:hypothetical protein